jgi:RND family efflux transporter MFP subunit
MKKSYAAILGLVIIVVAAIMWKTGSAPPAPPNNDRPSVAVSTISLTPGHLPATVSAYGSVGAGAGAEQSITIGAGGMVAAIPVIQGQAVAAGDTLAVISADPQSIAELRKAESAVTAARANRAHIAALLASRLATNADLAAADQALSDAAGTLAALRATGAGVNRTITAPFAGVISAVLAAPGTLQPAGAALLRLIDTRTVVATAGVPPGPVGAVKPGDPAAITMLNAGAVISGRVLATAAILDPQTGLTDVTISLDGPAPLGEPVQAVITTGTRNGYVVPRDAVQNDDQGDYAFQVDARNIAHRVTVHVLGRAGDQTVLAPDLNAAMPLVTTGAYQLDDGTAVRMAGSSGASN